MLKDFIKHIASETGLTQKNSRVALGIVLNAAERQGSQFSEELYRKLPGARTLSATIGADVGAATGVIARLIEKTPGGRSLVAANMLRDLQKAGLGHDQIGKLLPAIGDFAASKYGLRGFGHLGDLLGAGTAADASKAA